MIDEFADDPVDAASRIGDVAGITLLLQATAREARAMSYSEVLGLLGFRFTRPKMRALCRTLDEIDRRAAARGEPELAALVVRESDRLPGQGWWTGRTDYAGAWEGPEARAYLDGIHQAAFDFWRSERRD